MFYRETIKTIIPGIRLYEEYYFEDFTLDVFKNRKCLRYLTSEMNKLDFFIAYNEWKGDVARYKGMIRMTKGVITSFEKAPNRYYVYHTACCPIEDEKMTVKGHTKARLETECVTAEGFVKLVVHRPDLFFCKVCERFIFDTVEFMVGKAWDVPVKTVWPVCDKMIEQHILEKSNYVTLWGHKLIAVVSPEVRRREGSTTPDLDYETDVSVVDE